MKKGSDFFGGTSFLPIHKSAITFIAVSLLLLSNLSGFGQTLGDALNAPGLTWTTSGSGASGWSVQSSVTHDGSSAARSGLISGFSTSTLQTTVTGPGRLTFWWATATGFTLSFTVNGVAQTGTSGGPWKKETVFLSSGSQTLRWICAEAGGSPGGGGNGYVDEVTYEPGNFAPEIVGQPLTQSQVPGLDTMFVVVAQGTPSLSYQWQFNEGNISGATNSSLIVSNIQVGNLGNYRVIVTNATGSITSSVASLEFGSVAAWGQLDQVGWATATNGLTGVIGIAAGVYHDLALSSVGTVQFWGNDAFGVLTAPPDLTNAISIAAGLTNSVALLPDGVPVVWGIDGAGTAGITNKPPGLTNVVSVAIGSAHAVALKSDGTIITWGDNHLGQTNVPAGLSNVVAIAAGSEHSLAVKADGSVVAWGQNSSGKATVPAGLSNVVAVAAGSIHSLALRSDGTVRAWGANFSGVTNVPIALSDVVAIDAGFVFSVALKSNGTVVAWGNNLYGQTNVPPKLTNVVAISAAASHALALVGDGPPVTSALMSQPEYTPTGFRVTVPSQSGRVYRLEYKNSMADATWTPLPLVAGNGKDLVLTDATALDAARFYRVRRW